MSLSYSRTVQFSAAGGSTVCVELPMPPRGTIDRIIITQTSGTAVNAPFKIYDRKGASSVANDINVTNSGSITSITTSSGSCLVETALDHGLIPGDTFEIKGATVTAYNTTHTVVSVTSDTEVVTDISYSSDEGAGALWQTTPFIPTVAPVTHLVVSDTKESTGDYTSFGLARPYENRDNQSPVLRSRYWALWLEITPASSGAKTWEIGYTAKGDSTY
jgi:hypothetical protein